MIWMLVLKYRVEADVSLKKISSIWPGDGLKESEITGGNWGKKLNTMVCELEKFESDRLLLEKRQMELEPLLPQVFETELRALTVGQYDKLLPGAVFPIGGE